LIYESIVGGASHPDYIIVYNDEKYEKLYESLYKEYLTNSKTFMECQTHLDKNFVEKDRLYKAGEYKL